MNKKKFPKAVQRTADDMRNAGAPADDVSLHQTSLTQTTTAHPLSPVSAGEIRSHPQRRLTRAQAIVERYSNFSAVGGMIPLPLLNVAAVTALIDRMVKSLCNHYGLPYQQGRARALAVSLAAGSMPTTAYAVTTTTLVYFLPGANLLGLAVSSVTASACARGIGRRFVDHFEAGGTLAEFPVVDRR